MIWPAEAVWEAVSPHLPGFTVEILPQVDSTNTELMRRARAGRTDPVLLVAEQQTAGRGRLGRTWVSGQNDLGAAGPPQGAKVPSGGSAAASAASVGALSAAGPPQGAKAPSGGSAAASAASVGALSAAGPPQGAKAPSGGSAAASAASVGATSLTFSLGLPLAPTDWSGLSLAVGVSLAESLHSRIQLKWPNDLWLDDRKLAGILIETASFGEDREAPRYAVIGVGINIAAPQGDGLSTAPAWVREVLPQAQAGEILVRVAAALVQAVKAFEVSGFAPFSARFHARDALRGRAVVLSDGSTGTAEGISEAGALLVHTAAGMNTVISSEVSVRPAE